MSGELINKPERLWVYTLLPALILNIWSLLIYIPYYALLAVRPEIVSGITPGQITLLSYSGVVVIEWGFALSIIYRSLQAGIPLRRVVAPSGSFLSFRWYPALALFLFWNALFAIYFRFAERLYGDLSGAYAGIGGWEKILFVLIVPLSAAFCEELIWRGYIPPHLEAKGYRTPSVILLASLSFALIHGVFLVDKVFMTFILGIAATYYYIRERNLLPLFITHWVADFWSFSLLMF